MRLRAAEMMKTLHGLPAFRSRSAKGFRTGLRCAAMSAAWNITCRNNRRPLPMLHFPRTNLPFLAFRAALSTPGAACVSISCPRLDARALRGRSCSLERARPASGRKTVKRAVSPASIRYNFVRGPQLAPNAFAIALEPLAHPWLTSCGWQLAGWICPRHPKRTRGAAPARWPPQSGPQHILSGRPPFVAHDLSVNSAIEAGAGQKDSGCTARLGSHQNQ